MRNEIQRRSAQVVSIAQVVHAAWCLLIAMLVLAGAIWLLVRFGMNIWIGIIDFALVLLGLGWLVEACKLYATSTPQETPDARQRYFESRMLYVPKPRKRASRDG